MMNYCKTCGLRSSHENKCLLHNRAINPATDFCSWRNKTPTRCSICGKITMNATICDGAYFCGQCSESLSTCVGCVQGGKPCSFETDPSPIPKVVQKQIRQGPMTQIVQVKNPDRIAITCKLNCPCWNGEYCGQEDGWCSDYNPRNFVNSESDGNS